MERKLNVVVFGESGSGKSSTVNLLLGEEIAIVSDRAVGCTFEFQKYETGSYNLYDTVGLSEGSQGTVKQSFAVNQLINLLKHLDDGVSLLVFVMEKGRIKKSLDENYKLFVEAICMKKVPVVLVITHCEMEMQPGQWWQENKEHFDHYGMVFDAVVCGCSMNPNKAPPPMQPIIKGLNETTVCQLREAINSKMLIPGWKVKGGLMTWLQSIVKTVLRRLSTWFGIPLTYVTGLFTGGENDFEERIYRYFSSLGYEELVARQMASDIADAV